MKNSSTFKVLTHTSKIKKFFLVIYKGKPIKE